MILNEVFSDFLELLNKHGVRYVMVGGWAVIFEGYSRTTVDMDIFVEPSDENANKILVVLKKFFGSTIGFVKEDFNTPDKVLMWEECHIELISLHLFQVWALMMRLVTVKFIMTKALK